ncbi:MAG: histidine kinase [Lachnospiraceae bacterium]|nr:histidine kinase [Lachnospiraceae bacterium]
MAQVKAYLNRILGIKLRYRMLLVYMIGGALPIILIGMYLVHGMSRILIDQAKNVEVTEMEMVRRQAEEIMNTVSTVTKYFYFDERLEEISSKNYTEYQDMVRDYRDFTSFLDYGRYYNSTIAWMNIYMKNPTIVENSRFIRVTQEMEEEEWYKDVSQKNGGALWRFHPVPAADYSALSMMRMLKTQRGEEVGVLAVYIRPERFRTLLQDRNCDTFVLLNGEMVVVDLGDQIEPGQIMQFVQNERSGQSQKNIFFGKQEYVMTCETIPLIESQDYLQIISFKSYQDILREVGSQTAGSAAIFVVSAVLSITIILLFSQSFSSRVENFRAQMQKAAEGNFQLEEKLGGSDEISDLYDYLGTMIFQIQKLLAEIYRERLHAERLTIQQKDAEFKMLASQINPHFLYNTLETIRMRARKSRQYDIEELVRMLAKIMRSTLQAGNSEVTIQAETELVEHYLKIQQYRFGERIQYRIYVEEDLKDGYILPLIMQPIVENSIIHGLEGKEGIGTIDIRIFQRDKKAVIAIEDDGLGMDAEKLEELRRSLNSYNENGKHIGVSNVHQRVKLKYGDAYGVTIDSVEESYTRVEILLPGADELGGKAYVQGNDN